MTPSGMCLIPNGTFMMGSVDFYSDERPIREVRIGSFWIDEVPVTNAQFGRFVEETGHITFAEVAPDPADYPSMDLALAVPGSAVFVPPLHAVDLTGEASWWRFLPGANWRHPTGPSSSIEALQDHPVVHVALSDAEAYAAWGGKALPTEAEWEYAARGGLRDATYAWGDEFRPMGQAMAKTWDGVFPWINQAPRGLERTSPVKSYPANGFALYDMIGNVWEWTSDRYAIGNWVEGSIQCCAGHLANSVPLQVTKGGSHLCTPEYCQRYRPAARWPQPIDTTTSHMGFRCVVRTF